ncbi:CU044_5270 family protein [Streptomyces sp. NPDC096132]|uniref:CU044_5270 family protein n=1 Tax=Streptomyces sp. NPDC096132 TaxID=3366075 RepID=UPI00382F9B2A
MNDVNEPAVVRALRADAPLPDSGRLAPQRALLSEAVRREAAGESALAVRARPPRRRIVLVAVAASLVVTGTLVAVLPGDGPTAPGTTAAQPPASGGHLLSARASADTLELAAATVEKLGATEPGPKQWVYEKSTSIGDDGTTGEHWTRWDGTGEAWLPGHPRGTEDLENFDPDKLQVWYGPNQEEKWKKEGYDDRSQRQFYRFLATLPSDPDRMLAAIRKEHAIGDIEGETQAQRDWREIDVLYRSVLIPPNAQAGLFRALAKIPGARVETGIKDPIGRRAIGVMVNYAEPSPSGHQGKQELYFDPETYAYLGEESNAAPFPTDGDGPPMSPDALADIEVRNAWGVVDKPGERPKTATP